MILARPTVAVLCAGLFAAVGLTLSSLASAQNAAEPNWAIQYFYDEEHSQLAIADLAFPSAARGIAVGTILDRDGGKPRFTAVVTSDGGQHWSLVPLKEQPRSVFFLNESAGWMVTRQGIWFTEEAGRSWTRLSDQIKPNKKLDAAPDAGLLLRVLFLDPKHGYGVGLQKSVFVTNDGGRTWSPVGEAAKPSSNPAYSYYSEIAFADARHGMIVGGYAPPRRRENARGGDAFDDDARLPDWMDPERALRRREVPTLTLEMETRNGGMTWTSATAPLIGSVAGLRLAGAAGLLVLGYADSFEWPSEVFRLDLETGKSVSAFKLKDRRVTDAAVFVDGPAYLSAVEPPGRMVSVPIPGKLKILTSLDLLHWREMKVDYRAVAGSVVLAGPDADHVWAATDTGMILKLHL